MFWVLWWFFFFFSTFLAQNAPRLVRFRPFSRWLKARFLQHLRPAAFRPRRGRTRTLPTAGPGPGPCHTRPPDPDPDPDRGAGPAPFTAAGDNAAATPRPRALIGSATAPHDVTGGAGRGARFKGRRGARPPQR